MSLKENTGGLGELRGGVASAGNISGNVSIPKVIHGQTPYIKDGNWWIGDIDTGVKAEGVDGKDGFVAFEELTPGQKEELRGHPGEKGDPGKSAYEYAKDGGYTGTEEEFGIRLAEILDGNSNEPKTFSVTNNLTNVSTSNTATTAEEGSSYTATLTVIGSGMMNNPTVTMGGVTQSGVWTQTGSTKGTINIPSVTGDIVITCGS